MRLTAWLMVAALFPQSAAVAQQDSSFKNVEYIAGKSTMPDKKKGTLIVSAAEVKLVDKKGQPYLSLPLATIRKVTDTIIQPAGGIKKKLASRFLGSSGPDHQLILTTQKDSASAEESIVFKLHDESGGSQIATAIRARMNGEKPAGPASGGTAGAAPTASAADSAAEAPPLMVVANPFAAASADSDAAVQVGTAIRDEIAAFVGDKFQVVTRKQMNTMLEQYGYPADAMLDQSLVVTLAKQLQAPVVVTGDIKKGNDGKYVVTASLAGVDNPSSNPVTVTQNDGESLPDFGRRVADALKGPQQPTPSP